MKVDVGIMHIVVAMVTIYIPFYLRAFEKSYRSKIILGSIYIAQSIMALVSTDIVSLYVHLELMMVWAVALIMGDSKGVQPAAALNYFLVHLVAGTTMLCGFLILDDYHFSEASGSIIPYLYSEETHDRVGAFLVLLGSMSIIAVPPFSTWFVASYSHSSPMVSCILVCCTTKVVSVILFHLFAGLDWFLYIGLFTVIVNLWHMSRERKLRVVWIYGALSQLGINLMMISDAGYEQKEIFYLHITIQILYQALLANIVTILEEHGVMYLDDVRGYKLAKFNILSVAYVFAILNILGMPWMVTYSTKGLLQGSLVYDLSPILYYIVLFFSGYAIPVRSLAFNCKYSYAQLVSISFLAAVLFIESIYYSDFWQLFTFKGTIYIGVVMFGALARYKYRLPYIEYRYKGMRLSLADHSDSPIIQFINSVTHNIVSYLGRAMRFINSKLTLEYTLKLAVIFIILSLLTIISSQASFNKESLHMPQINSPRKSDYSFKLHGQEIKDEYQWLRDEKWPDVQEQEILDYLNHENAYSSSFFDKYADEKQAVFEELKGKIKLDDQTVPIKKDEYFYYQRTIADGQYPIYARKHGSLESEEQIILDVNKLAEGKKFTNVGALSTSPDHKLLAYLVDFAGDERFSIRVLDIESGKYLSDEISDAGGLVWREDLTGFYYGKYDKNWRQNKIYFHRLGDLQEQDQLIFHEEDNLFSAHIARSSSRKHLIIKVRGHDSDETYFAPMDGEVKDFTLVQPRKDGIKYHVDDNGQDFYILTNDQGPNFRIAKAAFDKPSDWQEYINHRDDAYLNNYDLTAKYLLLDYQVDGLTMPEVRTYDGVQVNKLQFTDAAYEASIYSTNFEEDDIRVYYSSLARPNSTYQYSFKKDLLKLLKIQEIPSGFNPAEYQVERVWAPSGDVQVPVTLLYKKSLFKKDGSNPLYLYGYGSYGYGMPKSYRHTAISLADRGIIFAIAHIRGGDDLGFDWYLSAKFLNKKRTFDDFIHSAEYLIEQNYTAKGNIAIAGGSAGGMLMGNVLNQRPELFGAAIAHVPFVDVLNTMLDDTLPLTPGEFKEWGNPKDKEYGEYMLSYSPYDNVKTQNYPPIYVIAGLTDPRVGYWEAAKWVARLRDHKQDDNLLMLKTNMDAGHQGASGRFDYLKEVADDIIFVSKMLKNVK